MPGYIEHDQETGQKKMVVYLRDKGPNDKPNKPTALWPQGVRSSLGP